MSTNAAPTQDNSTELFVNIVTNSETVAQPISVQEVVINTQEIGGISQKIDNLFALGQNELSDSDKHMATAEKFIVKAGTNAANADTATTEQDHVFHVEQADTYTLKGEIESNAGFVAEHAAQEYVSSADVFDRLRVIQVSAIEEAKKMGFVQEETSRKEFALQTAESSVADITQIDVAKEKAAMEEASRRNSATQDLEAKLAATAEIASTHAHKLG